MARERLTQKELAARLDLDPRQIRNLDKKPGFPTVWEEDEKRYPWPEVLHWYVRFKLDSGTAKLTGPVRLQQAQIRDLEAKAAKSELALSQMRGDLLERDLVRRERRAAFERIRNLNQTRASRWAPLLDGLTGPLLLTRIEDLCQEEMLQLQQSLLSIATYQEALASAAEDSDDDDDAPAD